MAEYIYLTAYENLSNKDIGYIDDSGQVRKADATLEESSKGFLVMTIGSVTAGVTSKFLVRGYYDHTGSTLTIGGVWYLSAATPGAKTGVKPTGAGQVQRIVGYTLDAVDKFYFNPSQYYELLPGGGTSEEEESMIDLIAGETLASGDVCYIKSDGKAWKAKADAVATTAGMLVMANEAISSGATGEFVTRGQYTTSGLTAGAEYYLSDATSGAKTTTKPSGTGEFIRVVGYAVSATNFFFDSDKTYFEI